MKIISLSSENIKRLSAVEIKPSGDVVVIGGKNGAGKSSVLDSIAYALGGKDAVPSQPIRKGEDHAEVVIELDDMTVTRRFTDKGSYLTVTNRDGAKYPSPQRMLDGLVGRLSFDPLVFSRMTGKEQAQHLRELVGLDTDELDAKRVEVYGQRTLINRDAKGVEANLKAAPYHDDAPDAEVDIASLIQQRSAAAERLRLVNNAVVNANTATRDLRASEGRIVELEAELANERMAQTNLSEQQGETAKVLQCAKSACEGDNIPAIDGQIATADQTNRKVRENATHQKLKEEAIGLSLESGSLTKQIDQIDADKKNALATAEYPVDGLGFTEDGLVTFGGIPFDQASSAEQLRVSVAMGLAMNPKLRVLLIRDGSLLDDESLTMVATMAADQDAQVWIERVGEGDDVSVVIEDGAVRSETVAVS